MIEITIAFLIEASTSKTDRHIALEETEITRLLHNSADEGAEAPLLATGHTQEQQDVIDHAWEVSNGDMRFLYLLTGENGEYTYKRRHDPSLNTMGVDMGTCGINSYFHPTIVNDPRFFTDMRWQIGECYRLYTEGTTFYAINRYDRDSAYRAKIHAKFQ